MKKFVFLSLLVLTSLIASCGAAPAVPSTSAPVTDAPLAESGLQMAELPFLDDFSSDAYAWYTQETENYRAGYGDGNYVLETFSTSDYYYVYGEPDLLLPGDVSIEVDATPVSGSDVVGYGLICRLDEAGNNYYGATIDSSGYAVIWRSLDSEFDDISSHGEWIPGYAINLGQATNHIRFDCVGNVLALYVNDVLIVSASDDAIPAENSYTAVFMETWSAGEASVSFDNFSAAVPTDALTSAPPMNTTTLTAELPFSDDFSGTANEWYTAETSFSRLGYGDGVYTLEITNPFAEYNYAFGEPNLLFPGDVRIEADITVVSSVDEMAYGFICRRDYLSDNYYIATITVDGAGKIFSTLDGSYATSENNPGWVQSDAINQGNATNHVRFDCIGDTLSLYVNDALIVSVTDTSIPSAQSYVGVVEENWMDGSAVISVDNFTVTQP